MSTRTAIVAGGVGSVALFLVAAQRKGPPPLLIVLFVLWIASPFVLAAAVRVFAKRWPERSRAWIDRAAVISAAASLAIYAVAALATANPPTPVFVVTAPAAWIVIAIATAIAAADSRQ